MLLAALALAGCTRHVTVPHPHQITIYYCKAGSGDLVRVPVTVDPKLSEASLERYALDQLFAGPPFGREAVVLFPQGTTGNVATQDGMLLVDLHGAITRGFGSGGTDEASLFKSLTYTMTGLPGIKRVQVLLMGKKAAALPGGAFELDEPLTRATFSQ